MNSIDLFNDKKNNIEFNKNKKIKTSTTKYFKCLKNIYIKLVTLFSILISNVYLIYLSNSINNFKGLFPESFFSKKSKSNDPDKINKAETIIKESFTIQQNFCDNTNKYLNQEYENMIKLTDFSFKSIDYKIYVYKKGDNYMSNFIIKTKGYDINEMTNFYDALEYYGKTNNILNKKDIYMLDLGGNLGVYPSYFGRLGYTVLSFEASPRNYYLLKKNYCQINRNAENIIIINRGVSNQEKICNYYTQITGLGN